MSAPAVDPTRGTAPDAKAPRLADRLAAAMARAGCAGAVAGVWAAGDREVAAAGLADWETRQSLTPGTRLPVASVTKAVVATAVARVWQARGIALTTPLVDLLPDLAGDWRASRRLSAQHLLSHTSGLRPQIPLTELAGYAYATDGLAQAVRHTVHRGQIRPLGSAWQYSNPGYALAGYALGVVGGTGLEAVLRQYVLEPAGMTDTSFGGAQASGHQGPAPVRGPYPRAFRPAGGLVSTVDDLLSFAAFAIDDATLPVTGTPVAAAAFGGRYGLGWILSHGGRVRWHVGDWGGVHAMLLLVPRRRLAVAIVGNDDGAVALRERLVWAEVARLAGPRRPRVAPYVYSGWSRLRLASSRAAAAVRRLTPGGRAATAP
jgi:CubicO group peptidase (beta-lactamase class C family)